ncbi:hypothetical protein TREMEDRAFT_71988 [Tremella mesenterica DSM 1558]|uniref:uncharacterized protein n=1 Tax=Tremella mesenterica (strain ATCC 24925 / CBS 8224 / DSM 1558 / NBRC 9311 / NRRL Y-6157 / RJB 2259-6 / UBC 559-6) TaxID=578456 RepID=UPI0003F494BD|nr:uncharacterized protein TREMEDRAFT_71988 [Tremella mesenterica DSM 1558]EIW68411.1 hypothetical protein TREMEDRAFT_71988 [Tremella mesenterica DSM 1558]
MDGEPPAEEDFSLIPLIERSQHKNWKARISAYTEVSTRAAKTASDTDPFFRPYVTDGQLLRKWCLDANAVAHEKAVEAVLALVQYSGETSARTRSDVMPAIVDKALGSTRTGTKRKGMDLAAMYVEVENTGEGVTADVLVGLDSKQPKIVAGSVSVLKELVESFGVSALGNIKPILKSISKIFAHTDKTVRTEGTGLVLALYTYIGEALTPALSELKPVQMADLQKSFDALNAEGKGAGTGKATRWTRKTQRERDANAGADDVSEDEVAEPAAVDPRSFLDPVNVLKLFPADVMDRLSSTSWKERVGVLEECNTILADPQNGRISDNNIEAYGSLVSAVGAKCKSDTMVNVVIEGSKLLEGLAKGIGRPFGRYRSVTLSYLLERLKERKVTVVEALGKALDAIFACTTLQDIIDDVLTSLKSKNPQVKEMTLRFLHRSLCTTLDAPGKDQVKPLAEALVVLLGDSAESTRSAAADCLGTLMKIVGERTFNPFVEHVGELQMVKVKEAFTKAEIRYRPGAAKPVAGGKSSAAAPIARKTGPPKANGTSVPQSPAIRQTNSIPASPPIKASGKFGGGVPMEEFAPPTRPPPTRFTAKTKPVESEGASGPPAKSAQPAARKAPIAGPSKTAPAPTKSAGPSKSLALSPSEPVKYRFSPEEAASQAEQLIPPQVQTKLVDPAWKVKLEGMDELVTWLSEEGGLEKTESEIIVRFLCKTPGWGEKMFQVAAKMYLALMLVAEKSPTFGRASAALAIGPLTDKLGDIKLKKPAGDALTAFAERTSLAFVLAQGYEPMTKQKAVKAQADALTWIKQQLIEFGIAGIPLRDLITFCKTGLQSPNAGVRSSATQVLVTVRTFVGADISGFLEDLNPQLLTTINNECEKVAGQAAPEPTRTQADLREAAPSSGKAGGKVVPDPLDDLIPRVDLDKLVASTSVIADSKSDAWKTRKDAFQALDELLEVKSNSRLKPNMGEIGTVLRKALGDQNLSVKMLALSIITKISTGMGAPFDKYNRILVAAVCSVCADQKASIRSVALNTLSAMLDASGNLDHMFTGIATSLENPNPALRASVLGWLAEKLQANPPSASADMTPLAASVLSCLEDRNGDVRKGAGSVLPFVVANVGFDHVMDLTSTLKPASKATIVPLINNAKGAVPAKSSGSSTAAAPSAVGTPRAKVVTGAKTSAPPSPAARGRSPAPGAGRSIAPPGRSLAMKALSSAPTTRPPSATSDDRPTAYPKSRLGSTRPTSVAPTQPIASPSDSSRTPPFIFSNSDLRAMRVKKDSSRWTLEPSPKSDLSEYLQVQMEATVSPELLALLFSKDHRAEEDYMAGLSQITEFYSGKAAEAYGLEEEEITGRQLANVDLALKYAALKLLGNNSQLISRCLEVIGSVVETLSKSTERLSDTEVKSFVPALVFKLGDAKFVPKLQPIFDSLGTVTATSQVLSLLVQFGLEDKHAGKTCKNETLGLIEKAYKKRGSILRIKDEKGFYDAVARCIQDSGTRQAALSLMANLQLQGGSPVLQNVIDSMPQASKDMLANRKATMVASKAAPATIGGVARASASALAATDTPSRLKKPTALGAVSPGIPKLRRTSLTESPKLGSPRNIPSPSGLKPRSNIPSPAPKKTALSALPRATTQLAQPTSPPDAFSSRLPVQPPRKGSSNLSPLLPQNGFSVPGTDTLAAIDAIRQDDLEEAIDALKTLQELLLERSDTFRSCTSTLVETLGDELNRGFTPPENLLDLPKFRLVKHLLQAVNNLSANQDLMRRLKSQEVYTLIQCLSLRLVQADRLGGAPKELAGFMNQIMIQIMSMAERDLVFRVMFRLFVDLSGDFSETRPDLESEVVAHADLVLKCLWKRCRVIDDDLRHGRVRPGTMLNILEEFTQAVNPMEYRRREKEGVALGELPLRTIKTIMQRIIIYAKENNQEVFDILRGEFGDRAADTIVYSYIFRLLGKDEAAAARLRQRSPQRNINGHSRPHSPVRPLSVASSEHQQSEADHHRPVSPFTAEIPPAVPEISEAEMLVKGLGFHNQQSQLDKLHDFITANPEKEPEVQKAISAHLSGTVQIYIRRALEQRRQSQSPIHETVSPVRSPNPTPSTLPAKPARRSLAPGPRPSSVAVDKSAPIDDQLSAYKALFNRGQNVSGSGSEGGHGSPGEPLSEILPPQ